MEVSNDNGAFQRNTESKSCFRCSDSVRSSCAENNGEKFFLWKCLRFVLGKGAKKGEQPLGQL